MLGLPIKQVRASGGWGLGPQTPVVEMPCLSVGHDLRFAGGTARDAARADGKGAVAMTSTTYGHGPLPTEPQHMIPVIPGLTRDPAFLCTHPQVFA